MWNRKSSVTLSLAVCYFLSGILTLGLFLGPWAVKMWLCLYRGFTEESGVLLYQQRLFACCFYPSAVFAYVTLYSLIRLLLNIQNDAIFVTPNVRYLRRISWCCFAVALLTLAAVCVFPGFKQLLVQFCIFPSIKTHLIDPYYAEHPEEDLQLRKRLDL